MLKTNQSEKENDGGSGVFPAAPNLKPKLEIRHYIECVALVFYWVAFALFFSPNTDVLFEGVALFFLLVLSFIGIERFRKDGGVYRHIFLTILIVALAVVTISFSAVLVKKVVDKDFLKGTWFVLLLKPLPTPTLESIDTNDRSARLNFKKPYPLDAMINLKLNRQDTGHEVLNGEFSFPQNSTRFSIVNKLDPAKGYKVSYYFSDGFRESGKQSHIFYSDANDRTELRIPEPLYRHHYYEFMKYSGPIDNRGLVNSESAKLTFLSFDKEEEVEFQGPVKNSLPHGVGRLYAYERVNCEPVEFRKGNLISGKCEKIDLGYGQYSGDISSGSRKNIGPFQFCMASDGIYSYKRWKNENEDVIDSGDFNCDGLYNGVRRTGIFISETEKLLNAEYMENGKVFRTINNISQTPVYLGLRKSKEETENTDMISTITSWDNSGLFAPKDVRLKASFSKYRASRVSFLGKYQKGHLIDGYEIFQNKTQVIVSRYDENGKENEIRNVRLENLNKDCSFTEDFGISVDKELLDQNGWKYDCYQPGGACWLEHSSVKVRLDIIELSNGVIFPIADLGRGEAELAISDVDFNLDEFLSMDSFSFDSTHGSLLTAIFVGQPEISRFSGDQSRFSSTGVKDLLAMLLARVHACPTPT